MFFQSLRGWIQGLSEAKDTRGSTSPTDIPLCLTLRSQSQAELQEQASARVCRMQTDLEVLDCPGSGLSLRVTQTSVESRSESGWDSVDSTPGSRSASGCFTRIWKALACPVNSVPHDDSDLTATAK